MDNFQDSYTKDLPVKPFTYLKEQHPYLTNYHNDGGLDISNNWAERSIKPYLAISAGPEHG